MAHIWKAICLTLLAAVLSAQPTRAAGTADSVPLSIQDLSLPAQQNVAAYYPKRAAFKDESASQATRHVADWVVDSGDNRSLPFLIIDKVDAKVFVFDAAGRLRGATPALLGLARGDDSVPGIGTRKLSAIRPDERTTPAGRFVASMGRNLHGQEIIWIDYDTAISLHRVITSNPKEGRAQRLATPTPDDNRISYGCINVPSAFFNEIVMPAFTASNAIVYILPETRSAQLVFGLYDVQEHQQQNQQNQEQARSGATSGRQPASDAPIKPD